MVIGSLKNTERVEQLHPMFKKVFDYVRLQNWQAIQPGKIELEGEQCWINLTEADMRDKSVAWLETHDRYIDIQIPLSGAETFGWQGREVLTKERDGGYQQENDITFYADRPGMYFTLAVGDFSVFFPEDAHAPLIGNGKIKKLIVKIRV